MYWMRLISACLIFPVLTLIVFPVPIGHGPFSAAYGPATKFQALLALLLLLSLMAAGVAARIAIGSSWSLSIWNSAFLGTPSRIFTGRPSIDSSLRC
jgi:hypothetical protein